MKTISKELFILALLLMIVVFMIGMTLYKYMPNNKIVPEAVTYTAESSTTAVLQEISESDNYKFLNQEDEVEDVIKSYSISPADLSTAASKQTYISGKTDPFAEYKGENPNGQDGNTVVTAPVVNPNTNSTGTFFEKKGSK